MPCDKAPCLNKVPGFVSIILSVGGLLARNLTRPAVAAATNSASAPCGSRLASSTTRQV